LLPGIPVLLWVTRDISTFRLFEVDHIPDSIEILQGISNGDNALRKNTDIRLDVLILQVERMLPNIDTNNRNMTLKRMGKSPFSKFKIRRETNSLKSGSWLGVVTISNFPVCSLYPHQPHPEPWTAAVLVFIAFLKASTEPKSRSRAAERRGADLSEPPPAEAGARFFQKRE
jgi:hypothetical protein